MVKMPMRTGLRRSTRRTLGQNGTSPAALPVCIPSQNPLEAHNAVIKTCEVTAKHVKTGVLNDSISGVFAIASVDPIKGPFGHYSGGKCVFA